MTATPAAALADLARAIANYEPLADDTITALLACLDKPDTPPAAEWAAARRLMRGLYDRGLLTRAQLNAQQHETMGK